MAPDLQQKLNLRKSTTEHRAEVSVIIPAHNEEKFLPGLLKSLAAILNTGLAEVIVVDNGSTDNSSLLAKELRCKWITLDKKVNPGTARNIGVEASSASIYAFLDADVLVTQTWIDTLFKKIPDLTENPLIITGDQYHISSSPSWIEHNWFAPLRMQPKNYINGGNIVTTKQAFKLIHGFDELLETGEDVDFCQRARKSGIDVVIDENFVTLHEGFPKTISAFIRRERWHGKSDFESLTRMRRSKIALMACSFLAAHLIFLAGISSMPILTNTFAIIFASAIWIIAVCIVSSAYRFKKDAWRQKLAGAAVSYIYFVGRSLSLLDVLCRKIFLNSDD